MKKSLTWIELSETEWLLVCVGYIVPFYTNDEKILQEQGILIQPEGVIVSTSSYTWNTFRVWKRVGLLKEDDKMQIENVLQERNKD